MQVRELDFEQMPHRLQPRLIVGKPLGQYLKLSYNRHR